MAGRYKAYPEYKDSGVEWLRCAPSHWSCVRMDGYASTIKDQISPKDIKDEIVTHYSIPTIQELGIGSDEKGESIDSNKFVVQEGDVLFSKLNPRKATISTVLSHTNRIVASTEMVVLRLKDGHGDFLSYLLKSQELKSFVCSQVESATKSHQRVNPSVLSKLYFICPPLPEQKQIARFLDHETAKIDRLIAKQQALIALLKEKRQAVISHAVTKGLNPNAKMKDSGVEWLGEVPEHWEVVPLKYMADSVNTGGTPKEDSSFSDEGEVEWFTPGDFTDELKVPSAKKRVTSIACEKGDAKTYKSASVLIIGIGATLGRVTWCDRKFSCNQQINVIEVNDSTDAKFLTFSLVSQEEQMRNTASAATLAIMNQDKTKSLWLARPSKSEQLNIVTHLEKCERDFTKLLEIAKIQINLLQERRTALISAAVTGKIDVRDWEPACAGGTEE